MTTTGDQGRQRRRGETVPDRGPSTRARLLVLVAAAAFLLPAGSAAASAAASVSGSPLAAPARPATTSAVPDVPISVQDATTTVADRAPSAVFPEQTGADQLWAQGDTGQGVNVAVVDTGIDPLPDVAGRLVGGVDLTGAGNPFEDDYGHGTFVAGLVAGDGASSAGLYMGEAPGAGLVSVKVAGASGQTDLPTVLAGIAWVISHRQALNIGVMNLSFGMVPFESTVLNPLDQAVEQAWNAGIVVVAAAGNAGPFNGTILSPGDDPLVITAGAVDDQGQPAPAGDVMTSFSSVGPTNPDGWIKPDVAAPGRSVVSLRVPGSTIDQEFPSARVGSANFVGSGTSFSSAVTSGAAALVLSELHGARPDDIKARLLAGAVPGPVADPFVDGHGIVSVPGALAVGPGNSVHLTQVQPTAPTSEGTTVSLADRWATSSWNGANYFGSFSGGSWNGASWNGASWNGVSWNGVSWNGFTTGGNAWNGASWNGASWNGASWNGVSWNGVAWNGSAWNGASWNGGAWNSGAWNGGAWNSGAWNSGAWNGGAWT